MIWSWVTTAASRAKKFVIVSPFFSMDSEMKILLESVRDLQVVLGDEFSSNNPRPLEELSKMDSADIRCVYTAEYNKRLHAKVFYAVESCGRRQALIGSANFTISGLKRNEEQAVSFDSACETDRLILDQIEHWIGELQESASAIDWERAKREYEKSPNRRIPTDDFEFYLPGRARNWWVLKATEGSHGTLRWDEFVEERVISVGWNDIVGIMGDEEGAQPNEYSRESLNAAAELWAEGEANPGDPRHAAKILFWFSQDMSIGDRVIICRGYAASQIAAVCLYGLAIVDGDVFDDSDSEWWRLKRSAVFRRMDIDIPKEVFVNALRSESLLQTMHRITKDEYEEFSRRIQEF